MFTVRWTPDALSELASLWVSAAVVDRPLLTEAVDEIDRILRHNPSSAGESREGELRILIVPPVAIQFRVWEVEQIAQVVNVWRFRLAI